MKFNFDAEYDRLNTNSLKWDVREGELAMWVADMDFRTAPAVEQAVLNRAKTGIYGYSVVPEEWYGAIINWWKNEHAFTIEKDWLCFCTGVVPAVSSIVRRVTNVGDNVVLLTPVYDIFFHSVENAGRHVLESGLIYSDGCYEINFADLEKKLAHPLTTLMILCNPHNPVGKIWTAAQLEKIGALCKKYGVTVLSDEIHCDVCDDGFSYTPFAGVSEICKDISVTCISASKAFNIAGLQSAAVFVPNAALRNNVVRGLNSDEVAEPNCFAAEAVVAAFTEGGGWLKELRGYITRNKKFAAQYIAANIPKVRVCYGNSTYLLWLDCTALTDNSEQLCSFIRERTGLYLSAGSVYRGNGNGFLRLNAACPEKRLSDGLNRLKQGVEAWIKEKAANGGV